MYVRFQFMIHILFTRHLAKDAFIRQISSTVRPILDSAAMTQLMTAHINIAENVFLEARLKGKL